MRKTTVGVEPNCYFSALPLADFKYYSIFVGHGSTKYRCFSVLNDQFGTFDTHYTRCSLPCLGPRVVARSEDNYDSNLVDPASSHMLVSRLSHACLSINEYTVKLRTAHSNSYRLFDISDTSNMDTRSNSRANTCVAGDFTEPQYY